MNNRTRSTRQAARTRAEAVAHNLVVDASGVLLEVPNRATVPAFCLSALDLPRQSCGKE
ncbi:hypothetical protein BKA03_002153 [Demequina lutea]|uniref:Uncharacterized protein n=1 Tax=Demequina lutea TaxID=431489 RepID=A0A7Y9ZAZ6_9MICO|nr:hypothetical protein [Demequina lutea]